MNYSLGNRFFRNGFDIFEGGNSRELETLRTDIYEQDNTYYLNVEVPGVKKENIEVGYENGYLTILVKQEQTYEENGEYLRKERMTSRQERTFYIGEINEDSIKASCENGILTIRLEKKEAITPSRKQITIE